ncbi:hypothetical protein [Aeromicrobium sp.]|uniref:hypothetical protein n=1 Tax=Aeromicrobium sp. TaxID=1871063 RepID=UPI001986B296|nr:hypothetical protein [Aeromicrobium sp.]MBC7631260.1 hypothetical protein [Aeromicrobium sp.]
MSTDTTTKVVSNRERLSGVVQAVGKRPADIERRWWESTAIFVIFTVSYSVLGYWLVVQMHVVGFETLDRFDRGLMIFHNEPPKLSSVGFDYPPLSIVLVAPFTVIPALARSLIVVPVVSAIFAGLTMMFINTMMRRAQVIFPLRAAVLVTLGLNPLVVMYASIGARNFMWLAFVMAALGALFAWYVTADIRFVMIAGLAYAVAALTGYGSLVWFLISLIMVAAILSRLGADGKEVEGTTVGFAAPTVYVIALWSAFNLILLFRPLAWLTDSSDAASSGGLDNFSLLEIARATFDLVVFGAPIAIIVLPALIFNGIARRNGFALWLGLMLLVSILAPGVAVLVRVTDSPMLMNNALPILLVSVVGAIWLARSSLTSGVLVAGILAVVLLLSIPWTFAAMSDFKHQGIERAFHDAITTQESQDGAATVDGSVVGYSQEEDMADYIRENIDTPDSILTDNSQTYAVILLTGDPALFFDRVDQSDGPWRRAAKDPAAHVDYMLLPIDTSADLLSKLYPQAAAGDDAVLKVIHGNRRYVLVKVPDGYTYGDVLPDSVDANGNGIADAEEGTADAQSTQDQNPTNLGGVDGLRGEPDSSNAPQPSANGTGSTSTTSGTTQ